MKTDKPFQDISRRKKLRQSSIARISQRILGGFRQALTFGLSELPRFTGLMALAINTKERRRGLKIFASHSRREV
jgi:hypothetical protein